MRFWPDVGFRKPSDLLYSKYTGFCLPSVVITFMPLWASTKPIEDLHYSPLLVNFLYSFTGQGPLSCTGSRVAPLPEPDGYLGNARYLGLRVERLTIYLDRDSVGASLSVEMTPLTRITPLSIDWDCLWLSFRVFMGLVLIHAVDKARNSPLAASRTGPWQARGSCPQALLAGLSVSHTCAPRRHKT